MNDNFMANLIGVVLIVFLFAGLAMCTNTEQEDCVRHHGHVTRIHGGHGGWICEGEDRVDP